MLGVAMVTALCACGKGTSNNVQSVGGSTAGVSADASNESDMNDSYQGSEAEEKVDAADITEENYKDYPVTPEEEFDYIGEEGKGIYIKSCSSDDPVIIVPETINGRTVVGLWRGAFFNMPELVAVSLPDTVVEIGDCCFQMSSKLKYVNLGKGLKYYGLTIFANCDSIERIYIPEGANSESAIAQSCSNLKDVYVPSSVIDFTNLFYKEQSPNAVVHTPSGSAAEQWAKDNGITVINDYDDYE